MTVAELIEALSELPGDYQVFCKFDHSYLLTVEVVEDTLFGEGDEGGPGQSVVLIYSTDGVEDAEYQGATNG